MRRTISIIFLLLISTFSFTFSQVVIKEKVDINPNSNQEIVNSISYGGCSYDFFDSTSLQVRFIPSEIGPGDTAIVQMWIVSSSGYSYRYYDDNRDLLELSVTVIPSYGTLTRIDSTQYRFVAADTMSADSVNVKVNYENYNQACLIMKRNSNDTTSRKTSNLESGCIDCGRYGPSVLLHAYGSGEITIKKPKVAITLDKTIIDPKDTVLIKLRCKNEDGSITDFPSGTKFEIGIIEGCDGGTLWAEGDTGAYLYNVSQPIKFIAKDDIQDDSLSIKIRAATIEGSTTTNRIALADGKGKSRIVDKVFQNNKKKNLTYLKSKTAKLNSENTIMKNSEQPNSKIEETQSNVCFGGEFQNKTSTDTTIKIVKNTILLGETKYYGVKKYNKNDSLTIVEIKTDYGKMPAFPSAGTEWTWLKDNSIWGSNPVSVDTGKKYGKKMGVYWETDKPVWNGNTNKGNLAKGLIRLVGRYWIKDSTYIVTLKAKRNNGDSASIEIKVIKPSKLGLKSQKPKDVQNHDIDIDSLCIKFGGENGIPPQFIKGQMRKETSSYYHFYPTYLYEPYTTQFSAFSYDKNLVSNLYYIKENATAFDPPVPNHAAVKDYHYPTNPVSVWYMIHQYSTLDTISPPGGWRKYGERVATKYSTKEHGVLTFYGVYSFPKKKFDEYKSSAYKKNKVNENRKNEPKANDEARENLIDFLKNDWDGGITGGTKGLINIKAQTRIAASYGLLQLTYPVAISSSVNYPSDKDNSPEELLETDNTKWSIKHLTNLLKEVIKSEKNKDANWSLGLENTFKSKIWYPNWNKHKTYGNEVMNFVKDYTPNK